ncbi:deleted in lung and esophageal cancer protein 1-like isoform X2 [Periplaneta americana]
MVAPGMSVRLKIQFCSESMDDEREQLIITVQEGKLLLITLTAFKQAPQLRVSELQHKERHQLTKAQRVHCTTIDCGPALLSDQVHLQLTFYNNGSNARFWFISEEEWSKEEFEDFVWWKNSILLPPFDLFPRAFSVDKGDNIVIHVLFRPTSPGLHVEKLYVMCDNYSYEELEIIGDGFCFEDFYVIIQNLEKTFPIDIEDDENALHFLDLGGSLPTGKVKNTFSVFNNSSLEMLYCWKQREAEIKCTPPEIIFNIPGLSVLPNVGTLIPNSKETFTVFCSFQGLPIGRYRQILQLFIVDVPSSSVSEKYKSHKLDHRRCVATGRTVVDILVAEIEVWLEILPIIVTLDPNFISVTGSKLRCDGVTSKRLVTVSNKTASMLTCEWQLVPQFDKPVVYVSCILTMTPTVFRMSAHSSVTCVLNMLPHDPGRTEERFRCLINGGAEVLELPVVVEVDEPVICPSVPLLDFGIVMRGNRRVMPLNITNKSTIEASWELQEFGYSTKNKELYPRDFINLCHPFGVLPQGNSCTHNYNLDATVPKIWYSLLRLSKTAEGINTNMDEYISVLANIIQPEVGIAAPPFHTAVLIPPGILYVGVPVTCTVSLRNYTSQNTSFKWGFPIGSDTDRLHVVVNPKCGEVRAESSLKVKVTVIPQDVGRIQSLYVPCFIEQEIIPVILSVEANIEGLNITFLLPKTEAETNSNNWLCFPWPPKGKVPGIETMTWSLPRMRSSFEAMKFSRVRALSDITLSSSEFGPNSSEEDLKRRLRYSRRGVKRSLDLSFIKVPHFEEDSLLSVPDLQEEVDLVSVSNVEFPLVHVPGIDGIPSIEFTPTYPLNLSTMSASKEEEVVVQEEEVNPEVEEEERNVKNNRKSRKKGKQLSEVQLSDHELMKNNSAILKDKSGSKKSKNSKINMKQKQKEVEEDRFEDAIYNIEQPEPKESDSKKQIESADGDNEEEDPQPTEEQLLSKVTLGTQFPSMTSSLSLHTSESSDTVDWPPVLVFTCLPCHKAIKKTFIVRNETPVLSALSFCVQNYCAKKSARELSLLQEVEMKVAGKHPDYWKYYLPSKAGIMFLLRPTADTLNPYESKAVDVWVYANTWGTYFDHITVSIQGLLSFYIEIVAEVVGFPLMFPMNVNSLEKEPLLRFGCLANMGPPQTRRVRIRNESSIDIDFIWHVFLRHPGGVESQPFSLVLDMYASEPHNTCTNTDEVESSDFSLFLGSYYGKEDFNLFKIYPREIHVPAYGEAMFQVKLAPIVRDKDITENVHLSAVAIGYIRIAEAYREEEGQFIRPWGSNLQPVQLVLDAVIETPLLTMDLVSANLKLRVDVPTIMGAPDGTYTEQWTLTYSNETQSTLSAQVDTRKPFEVVRITTLDCRGNRLIYDNFMVLESQQCAEVTVKCSLDVKDVGYGLYILEGDSPENPLVKSVTLKRDLVFTQKPSHVKQTVPLQVKMVYPSLNINTKHIDFSAVYVSDSKSFCLQVSNNSDFDVPITILQMFKLEEFSVRPKIAVVSARTVLGYNFTEIEVTFTPKKSKDYKEILEIKACVPGEWPKVNLVGVGTLNERFKVSGC